MLTCELRDKEGCFTELKRENERLKQEQGRNLQTVVDSLEEEIQFLKRHYDIEINLIRDQYEQRLREES